MAGEAPTDVHEWCVEVVERVPDRSGAPCHYGRWVPHPLHPTRSASVAQAIELAKELRAAGASARLTAPGFQVVALRDSFSVKRLGATG